ncbi:MAG: serine hydrolase [Verrucomicrobia bacterium]|nr:serine hydrolase [Verrucomicrobiota bacterium]
MKTTENGHAFATMRNSGGTPRRTCQRLDQIKALYPALRCLLLLLAAVWSGLSTPANADAPPPQAFQPLVQQLLDSYIEDNNIAGVAAGVAYHGHYYPFTAGVRDRDTLAPMTEETMFPVGSVTKIFTGIMLAYLVNEGTATLEDHVVDYLPDEVGQMGGAIKQVTLLELATHTSGITTPSPGNPAEQAYFDLPPLQNLIDDWIQWTPTPPEPGDPYLYNYANKGFLTLAFAVAEAGQRGGFNPLFQEVFRDPLQLRYLQTLGTMTPEFLALMTKAYADDEDPTDKVGNGVNANLIDMAPFLKACLLNVGTPQRLKDAIEFSQRPFRSKLANNPDRWMGLGWDLQLDQPYTVLKGGATAGAFSFLRLRPQDDIGVIVMANGKPATGSDIGRVSRDILDFVEMNGDRELAKDRPTSHSNGKGRNRPNDGDKTPAHFWEADGPDEWWQVDLEAVQSVGYFHVIPLWDGTNSYPYTVWTSLDGVNWKLAVDASHPAGPATLAGDGYVIPPRFARYVRVQSAGKPLKLAEVEVFEHQNRAQTAMNLAHPTLQIAPSSDPEVRQLHYSYRRLTGETNLAYSVSIASELIGWEPIAMEWGLPNIESEPSGLSEVVSWQQNVENSQAAAQFIRLVISSP